MRLTRSQPQPHRRAVNLLRICICVAYSIFLTIGDPSCGWLRSVRRCLACVFAAGFSTTRKLHRGAALIPEWNATLPHNFMFLLRLSIYYTCAVAKNVIAMQFGFMSRSPPHWWCVCVWLLLYALNTYIQNTGVVLLVLDRPFDKVIQLGAHRTLCRRKTIPISSEFSRTSPYFHWIFASFILSTWWRNISWSDDSFFFYYLRPYLIFQCEAA